VLAGGKSILGTGFRTDPSGRYFVIMRDGHSLMGMLDDPERVLASSSIGAMALFEQDDTLYLFGNDDDVDTCICEVYRRRPTGYALADVFRIVRPLKRPTPFVVMDFQPASGRALFRDIRDERPARWFLYSLPQRTLVPVGSGAGVGFFLKRNPLSGLDAGQ